jgi:hypothetical protein
MISQKAQDSSHKPQTAHNGSITHLLYWVSNKYNEFWEEGKKQSQVFRGISLSEDLLIFVYKFSKIRAKTTSQLDCLAFIRSNSLNYFIVSIANLNKNDFLLGRVAHRPTRIYV